MKKVLSLVLVLSMLLSLVAIAPFASSAAEHTLDQYNVGTEAYKFNGTVEFKEIYGRGIASQGYYRYLDPVTVKQGKDSSVKLVIDGVIEEGEWGHPSFTADSAYAAHTNGKSAHNIAFEQPSADNTYFHYDPNAYSGSNAAQDVGLKYDVYLMWDEDYLYVAANVYNPDGHGNTQTGGKIWDGDCFQFRVDKDGPNSVVDGKGYNAYYENEDGTNIGLAPWKTSEYRSGSEYKGEIPNIAVAYALQERASDTSKVGTTAVFDSSKRYWSHYEEVQDPENPDLTIQQLAYSGTPAGYAAYKKTPVSSYTENAVAAEVYAKGPIYASAYPTLNANKPYTQYEIAVPWAYIDDAESFLAKEGVELGLTTMVLNAKRGGGAHYSFLEWGNGINTNRQVINYQTCGGSNSLVLSGTAFNENPGCEHDYAAANCIRPEECTKCGDLRGFKVGHDYEVYDYQLATSSEDGYAKAICLVCEDVAVRTLTARYKSVQKHYYDDEGVVDLSTRYGAVATDTVAGYGWGNVWTNHTWTPVTHTDGSQGYELTDGATIYNSDATAKNCLWTDGQVRPAVVDKVDGKDTTIVTSMKNPYGVDVFDFTSPVEAGTYFCVGSIDASRTVVMDVDFWNLVEDDSLWHGGGYTQYMAVMVGEGARYHAGIFIVTENGTKRAFFAITEGSARSEGVTVEEFKAAALVYKEVDIDILGIGMPTEGGDNWHQFMYYYDNDAHVAMLFWDGELMVAEYDYHFANPSSEAPLQYANMELCVTNVEWATSSLVATYADSLKGSIDVGIDVPESDDTTVESDESSVEPEDSSVEPEDSSVEPEDSSVEPEDSSVEPEDSSVEPEDSSVEPEDSSVEPEDSSAEPEDSSADPEDSSADPEDSSADPEDSSNEPEVPAEPDPTVPAIKVVGEEKDGKIYVKYEMYNNPGIWSAAIDLSYNADALELESVTNGAIFSDDDYYAVDAVNGTHRFFVNGEEAAADVYDRTANGVLVEYVFAIKDSGKAYNFAVDFGRIINAAGQDVELELIDRLPVKKTATITVNGEAVEVTIGESFGLSATREPKYDAEAEYATVFSHWLVNGEIVTDLSVDFVVDGDVVIEAVEFVHADANGDGSVDSRDKVALQNKINGDDDSYVVGFDITLDGQIDSRDKVALLNVINDAEGYYSK